MPAPRPGSAAASSTGGGEDQPGLLKKLFLGFKKAATLVACRERYLTRGDAREHVEINLDKGDTQAEGKFFHQEGKVWRGKTHKEVPALNHSITDIQDYVKALPTSGVADYSDPSRMPQYASIFDFVATMRVSCEIKGSAFMWPAPPTNIAQSFSVAMTMCPPGHMVTLQNAAPVPRWLQRMRLTPGPGAVAGSEDADRAATGAKSESSDDDMSSDEADPSQETLDQYTAKSGTSASTT